MSAQRLRSIRSSTSFARRENVIIITSEMPELLAMSDRIMVMFEGHISGFLTREEATQETVVNYAIGGH